MRQRPKSAEVYATSCSLMPGGVNSPVRSFSHLDMGPILTASGKGDMLTDLDGNAYIDYCCSWGSLIHGHCFPDIVHAAQHQITLGSSFGTATLNELRLAQKISEHMPHLEKMRFVSSGTEATMSAIRLARGFTNRDLIVKFDGNYHGHNDSLLVRAGSGAILINSQASSKGVPNDFVAHTASLPYNDEKALKEFFRENKDKIAAVILEPVAANMGVVPATSSFISTLREETTNAGALLIFDEVVTGFRVGIGGAAEMYGVEPDLTCLGKIVGGGFPVAVFGGRPEIMDHLAPLGQVYQAGTLSGNPVAMSAGLAAINALERPGFYEELKAKTAIIVEPVRKKIREKKIPACIQSVGSSFTIFFGVDIVKSWNDAQHIDTKTFQKMFHFLFERGIYFSPSAFEGNFVSSVHTEDHLEETCNALCVFLEEIS